MSHDVEKYPYLSEGAPLRIEIDCFDFPGRLVVFTTNGPGLWSVDIAVESSEFDRGLLALDRRNALLLGRAIIAAAESLPERMSAISTRLGRVVEKKKPRRKRKASV
jgi:hypothetical protein